MGLFFTTQTKSVLPSTPTFASGPIALTAFSSGNTGIAFTQDGFVRYGAIDPDLTFVNQTAIVSARDGGVDIFAGRPVMAPLANGTAIVVWSGYYGGNQDVDFRIATDTSGVISGFPGPELIFAGTPASEVSPTVAARPAGDLIITYGATLFGIVTLANADGQVSTSHSISPFLPGGVSAINISDSAALPDNRVAVVYTQQHTADLDFEVYVQTFSSALAVNGAAVSLGEGFDVKIESLGANRYVVVWSTTTGIQATILDGAGAAVVAPFTVNTTAIDSTTGVPEVEAFADGRFIVSWTDALEVKARGYSATGVALTGETIMASFQHPSGTATTQMVVDAAGGGFKFSTISAFGILEVSSRFLLDTTQVGSNASETLNGAGTADLLDGGVGNDTLNGLAGSDVLNGGAGNDVLNGGDADDTLSGGEGNDLLSGGAGLDVVMGEAGDDVLVGGAGADVLSGGAGNDTYYVSDATTRISETGGGLDTVFANVNYTLAAGLEILSLYGAATLGIGNHEDNIFYTAGQDVTIEALQGDDRAAINGGNVTIYGGAGADTFTGSNGVFRFEGGDGADRLQILSGTGVLLGDMGDDLLIGGDGNDTLNGNSEDDALYGGAGNDLLSGGSGDDVLVGGAGIDTLAGDLGNDTYYIGEIGDVILGEANLAGIDTVFVNFDYLLPAGIEVLSLGAAASRGWGNTLNNSIFDAGQRVTISAGGGNDLVIMNGLGSIAYGEDGDDTLWDGEGDGLLVGGAGNDTLWGRGGVNALFGGAGNDTLVGGANADNLWGEDGDDVIWAGAGDDYAVAAAGADVVRGEAGNDTLWAGDGDDWLYGGAGNNVLWGQGGVDRFILDARGGFTDRRARPHDLPADAVVQYQHLHPRLRSRRQRTGSGRVDRPPRRPARGGGCAAVLALVAVLCPEARWFNPLGRQP